MHGQVFGLERRWLELRNCYDEGNRLPSPCRAVCRIDAASGLCEGCLRTLDEIAGWSALSPAAKRALWAQLPLRFDRLAREHEAELRRAAEEVDAIAQAALARARARKTP
ncbi:DUF1289 domain-containing protein [Derxia lacustris]|uniref:DUF1289 domain-containing protein n=1 Tax=Derxia lacustris TaxID=764842 RepID=UPI00111C67BA|nr:DUF1289 domain-containing protein [Derxia lacustris]